MSVTANETSITTATGEAITAGRDTVDIDIKSTAVTKNIICVQDKTVGKIKGFLKLDNCRIK